MHDTNSRTVVVAGDFALLCEMARPRYAHDDPGHDWSHIERVLAWADYLGRAEGAEMAILGPAAVLHDLVNVPKDHADRARASSLSADAARPLLSSAGYNDAAIARIGDVIVEHSYSLGRDASTVEAACLQDADRLDSLGAIGVMRAVTCGVRMGSHLFDRDDPFAERRGLDGCRHVLDHFQEKLLALPRRMNTATGRAEAEARVAFMRTFLDHLAGEIGVGRDDAEG